MAIDWNSVDAGRGGYKPSKGLTFRPVTPEPVKKKSKLRELSAGLGTVAGAAGNAIKNYVDQDDKGIGFNDVVSLPGRAAGDMAKAVYQPLEKGANMASYAINERTYRKMLEKGEITYDTYNKMVTQDQKKAGFRDEDTTLDLARKISANTAENTLNLFTGGKAGAVLQSGKLALRGGAKEGAERVTSLQLAKEGAAEGIKYGAASGVLSVAQEDDQTWKDYAAGAAGGAALGGALGAAAGPALRGIFAAASKAGQNLPTLKLDSPTRDALVKELNDAGETQAANKVQGAKLVQEVLDSMGGTKLAPTTPNNVSVPLQEQAIDPSKPIALPGAKPREEIALDPAQQTAAEIISLEDAIVKHDQSEALAVETIKTEARELGLSKLQYKEKLSLKLQQLDNQKAFANPEPLKLEQESAPVQEAAPVSLPAEQPKPEVQLVDDTPRGRIKSTADSKTATVEEAGQSFKTITETADSEAQAIVSELKARGLSEDEFVDMIEGRKPSKGHEDLIARHRELDDALLEATGKQTGKIKNHFFHTKLDDDGPEAEIFEGTLLGAVNKIAGFTMKRTGKMEDYSRDYAGVMSKQAQQAAYARYEAQMIASERGITLAEAIAEQEFIATVAKAAKAGKGDRINVIGAVEKLVQATNEGTGKVLKRATFDKTISTFEYNLQDAWVNLKALGIYTDDAFKPLGRAEVEATRIFNEVKDIIKDPEELAKAIQTEGFSPEQAEKLARKMQKYPKEADAHLRLAIQQRVTEDAIQTAIAWLRKNNVTDPNARALINRFMSRELTKIAEQRTVGQKITDELLSSVYSGYLGLSPRSLVNQTLETTRAAAAFGEKYAGMGQAYATAHPGAYTKKYGVESRSLQDYLDIKKNESRNVVLRVKRGADGAVMIPFSKMEEWKDNVFLYAAEAKGKDLQKAGKLAPGEEALHDFVLDNFEKYGHKYGTFGSVPALDRRIMKLALQFAQYGIKDLGLYYREGKRAVTEKDKAAGMYVGKNVTHKLVWLGILGPIYGASFGEVVGSIPGFGPLVDTIQTLLAAHEYETREAETEEREYDPINLVEDKNVQKKALALTPAGHQIWNKTGGAMNDMERGYNEAQKGQARFLAPETTDQKAIALAFGPNATDNAREYFEGVKKGTARPLGENQTEELKTTEDKKSYWKEVMDERAENRAEKKGEGGSPGFKPVKTRAVETKKPKKISFGRTKSTKPRTKIKRLRIKSATGKKTKLGITQKKVSLKIKA